MPMMPRIWLQSLLGIFGIFGIPVNMLRLQKSVIFRYTIRIT
jgi:hypothetical protein